ncbi:MAG: hypothetical protein FWH43_02805 [Endomicrobia bacterium]|nr:hypothetical protein [Endomicrobiia bacterium]
MKQIHKKFNAQQVKELFSRYSSKELTRANAQETLDVSKSHFFKLIKKYRQAPQDFEIKYERAGVNKLTSEAERLIKEELHKELARDCIAGNITEVSEGQKILDELVERSNYYLINSISQEPPYLLFKNGNKVWHKS